jgi:hypothetical protein
VPADHRTMPTPQRNWLVKPRVAKSQRPALFLVKFEGGISAPMHVPADTAAFAASRIPGIAQQRQARGELPPGKIVTIVRVR